MENPPNYYARNKEARKAYQRQYYLNNRDRIQYKRKYEEINSPEKQKARQEYNSSYYRANKEKILKRRRELYKMKRNA